MSGVSNTGATGRRVWFITGAASGFGLEILKIVLSGGEPAVATCRPSSSLPASLTSLQRELPSSRQSDLLILPCDISSSAQIVETFSKAISHFGRLDVVFNGAGYCLLGEAEATPEDKARKLFDVNFWGMVNVSKEAVRVFREVNPTTGVIGGRLLNVSSRAGLVPRPAIAYYSASKHATEAFTESLSKEMDPAWNIKITILEPGGFKTRAHKDNTIVFPIHPAYTEPTLGSQQLRGWYASGVGVPGDPVLAAERIYRFVNYGDRDGEGQVPIRLQLGDDSWMSIKARLESVLDEMNRFEEWSQGLVKVKE